MLKKIVPFVIISALAWIAVSCGGSTNPLVKKAESSVKSQNYQSALQTANNSIQQYPNDPLGYYYKGVALGQLAQQTKDTSKAKNYYQKMNKAFATAKSIADTLQKAPAEIGRISAVKNSLWRTEHNQGVAYATNDSLKKTVNKPLAVSVAHLENATMIEPDSTLSWNVLAQVNNMRSDYGQAAKAESQYVQREKNPSAHDYLVLSQYYRLDKKPQKAVGVLQKAHSQYPDSTKITENLADSYSSAGESNKAISTVEELVNKNPSNAQYHLSLGTQLYQAVLNEQNNYKDKTQKIAALQSKLNNASGSQADDIKKQISQLQDQAQQMKQHMDSLTTKAVTQLNETIKNRPKSAVAYNTLGIIYQNKAAAVFNKRNMTQNNQKAAQLDQQAKDILKKAMKNYEQAANIDPSNKKYWKSLFSVYTTLGMDKKASEAAKKAGINVNKNKSN